jgi:hypothetical protein
MHVSIIPDAYTYIYICQIHTWYMCIHARTYMYSTRIYRNVRLRVIMCCVCVRVRVYTYVCVCVCVRACVYIHIYNVFSNYNVFPSVRIDRLQVGIFFFKKLSRTSRTNGFSYSSTQSSRSRHTQRLKASYRPTIS